MKYRKNLIVVLAILLAGTATYSFARDYKVSAGISTGFEFYDRKYNSDDGGNEDEADGVVTLTEDLTALQDDNYDRFRITPLIKISSDTARDGMVFSYSPSFRYDYDTYDHDIDHTLSASYNRFFTNQWHVTLTEDYRQSDMVDDGSTRATIDSPDAVSDTNGRRQYWTNNLGFRTEYTYWESSQLSFGYVYSILENVDPDPLRNYENYDKHTATMAVFHQFDSIWNGTVSGRYVRGLYESTGTVLEDVVPASDNDLKEYMISTKLSSSLIEHHPLSLAYAFSATDYDVATRDDSIVHDIILGWQWNITEVFIASLGGGPTYVDISGQDGEWKYNANFGLQYEMERSSLNFTSAGGYEYQNFSGTDESGLRKYWQTRLDYSYQFLKDLSFSIYSLYRNEDRQELFVLSTLGDDTADLPKETINRKRFVAGTGLGYTFAQFYSVTFSYNYTKLESDAIRDNYDEHRLNLMLSYNRDLFSW